MPGLIDLAKSLLAKSLLLALIDPYRPERHYMRGPGPKWRAKHLRAKHLRAKHLRAGHAHG